jgi:hypothetical protein
VTGEVEPGQAKTAVPVGHLIVAAAVATSVAEVPRVWAFTVGGSPKRRPGPLVWCRA